MCVIMGLQDVADAHCAQHNKVHDTHGMVLHFIDKIGMVSLCVCVQVGGWVWVYMCVDVLYVGGGGMCVCM